MENLRLMTLVQLNQSTRTLKVLQLTTNIPATVPGCSAYLHNSLEVAWEKSCKFKIWFWVITKKKSVDSLFYMST